MKNVFLFGIIFISSLVADPRGSLHDAWSDWLLEQNKDIRLEDEVADNSQQEIANQEDEEE